MCIKFKVSKSAVVSIFDRGAQSRSTRRSGVLVYSTILDQGFSTLYNFDISGMDFHEDSASAFLKYRFGLSTYRLSLATALTCGTVTTYIVNLDGERTYSRSYTDRF